MNKFYSILGVIFIIFLGGLIIIPVLGTNKKLKPAELLGVLINQPIEKEMINIEDQYISRGVTEVSRSLVVIQSFSGGSLLKEGSGIVLTEDGLIIVTNSLVPASADVYQVFLNDKIIRASVVRRDFKDNLALLTIDEKDLRPAELTIFSLQDESGLLALYKSVILGTLQIRIEKLTNKGKDDFFRVEPDPDPDPEYDNLGDNAIVLSPVHRGKIVGMLDLLNKNNIKLIPVEKISGFWNSYISPNEKISGNN